MARRIERATKEELLLARGSSEQELLSHLETLRPRITEELRNGLRWVTDDLDGVWQLGLQTLLANERRALRWFGGHCTLAVFLTGATLLAVIRREQCRRAGASADPEAAPPWDWRLCWVLTALRERDQRVVVARHCGRDAQELAELEGVSLNRIHAIVCEVHQRMRRLLIEADPDDLELFADDLPGSGVSREPRGCRPPATALEGWV